MFQGILTNADNHFDNLKLFNHQKPFPPRMKIGQHCFTGRVLIDLPTSINAKACFFILQSAGKIGQLRYIFDCYRQSFRIIM